LIIKDPVFVINIYRSLKVSLIVDLKVKLGVNGGELKRGRFFLAGLYLVTKKGS